MELLSVPIEKPDAINFILGQTHFIKTVEDLHEALVGAVPGIRFGLALCEASGKCLVRWSGSDPAMIELAKSTEGLGLMRSARAVVKPRTRHRELTEDGAQRKGVITLL
jgi:adenosine/AMP kinase